LHQWSVTVDFRAAGNYSEGNSNALTAAVSI